MPLYEYSHPETGTSVTLIRPMEDRDKPVVLEFQRITAPSRIGVVGFAANPINMKKNVLDGYYREECNGGRFRSSYTKDQIKKAWSQPD